MRSPNCIMKLFLHLMPVGVLTYTHFGLVCSALDLDQRPALVPTAQLDGVETSLLATKLCCKFNYFVILPCQGILRIPLYKSPPPWKLKWQIMGLIPCNCWQSTVVCGHHNHPRHCTQSQVKSQEVSDQVRWIHLIISLKVSCFLFDLFVFLLLKIYLVYWFICLFAYFLFIDKVYFSLLVLFSLQNIIPREYRHFGRI